ncbi:MAG: asparagine--tRNA ligase [Christensenellaceae bacterium]|nr:asparagine--tRNA ligase [Christensenellaceae bacterium]
MRIITLYKDTPKDGDKISVSGWVRTARDSKNLCFIELNDGSCFDNLQVIVPAEIEDFEEIRKISTGSSLKIDGQFKLTPGMKQPFELEAQKVTILGKADLDYPLQKKRHSFEYLRSIAHLRPRTNTFYAVFKIRAIVSQIIHRYFSDRGFIYVHTPIITTSDAEGAGEMFQLTTLPLNNLPKTEEGKVDYAEDFFGKKAGLTVSGQLNVEAFCMAYGRVYTFGPTFRAEHSNTPRHAAEFWMIEPEIAFADLEKLIDLEEDMLKYIIKHTLIEAEAEMQFLNRFVSKGIIDSLNETANAEFVRLSYTDAVDILQKSGQEFEYPVKWGIDLQTEHERYLTEKHFKAPVFVYNYPKDIKAFYMRMNEDNKTVAAVDLLVPGVGELIGGSQREEREDYLIRRIEEMGLDKDSYDWYIALRRYGTVEHGGFGIGFERLIMYLTGISNIRDVLPFPRTLGSANY